ncbi:MULTISPECIES: DNA-processing protein DprA [unclassified Paracoccus (in: a-proteobacteria)]|uniref:DNA-processing protein DprA n=1 Tax=unclassified Paracoccus (in: a-proteobacteria) TaxID=2688777 RepID=UPI0012B41552|nr:MULTISPECIES: DNA-processing protein DprA [unclassified Paracoccus (in: a-proteobacteria)]UXU74021.1 DNA-processing protein DprA [Paracoccus sp. SMMA_5]UXU79909.1 DNA-processing protein DprA [Paracoccus sp. SMMA_5_TC]
MTAWPKAIDTHHRPAGLAADRLATLRLIRSRRVGPTTFHRLMGEHGCAERALLALPELARAAGIADYQPCPAAVAQAEIQAGRRAGARLLVWGDPDYPLALRDLADAPPVLWVRGDLRVLDRLAVAVIGARNASSLGLRMARGLAAGLAEAGAVVIAGLARGVDTIAHQAALNTGTVAVMAGGIDMIYPSENAGLAASICETGLLISEQPPGTEPVARHFPARNRIISGLARAVVVVEAAHRSGSLITARCALDQGREVMAVPGHPMDARAAGCNALIRDGALLVRNAADVLAAIGTATPPGHPPPRAASPMAPPRAAASSMTARDSGGPADLERRILASLGPSPTEENMLIRDLGVPAAALAPALLNLELSGRVQRLPGGRLALCLA